MEIYKLEQIAENEKINILNYKMKNNKARIITEDTSYIFMDYSRIESYA